MTKRLLLPFLALLLLAIPCKAGAEEVQTSAKACAVIDYSTGRVLLSHCADVQLPMASTTKVMTALVALEQGQLTDRVTAGRNAFGVPGTSIYLDLGETLTLEEMLYGLMLASGNDAAVAIAEYIGGTTEEFCRMMTERARQLGCMNTVFLTPHGLPQEGHYTTALDLARIAREAMCHETFREIVSTRRACIPWEGRDYDRVLNNKNKLLATFDGATGIKTGFTRAAGRCLVFGAKRNGMEIIGVVLCCADWFDEAARLMELAFDRYEQATLFMRGEALGAVRVLDGETPFIDAVLSADLTAAVPAGTAPQVAIRLAERVEAPILPGDTLGTACLMLGDETLCEVSLVAAGRVARDDPHTRWATYWRLWPLLPLE